MTFEYENMGSSSFMIYSLAEKEILDEIGLGMIANNRIKGILPVSYMQVNDSRKLRFNISSKIDLNSFLGNVISREKALCVFASICDALIEAEDYLLESRLFLLDKSCIFCDVSTGESMLLYLPVLREGINVDFGMFFKDLIFTMKSDPTGDTNYVALLINELNKIENFNLLSFRNVVNTLRHSSIPKSETKKGKSNENYSGSIVYNDTDSGEKKNWEAQRQIENGSMKSGFIQEYGKYRTHADNMNIGSYYAGDRKKESMAGKGKALDNNDEFQDTSDSFDKNKVEEKKGLFRSSIGGKEVKKKLNEQISKKSSLFSFGKDMLRQDESETPSEYSFAIPGRSLKEAISSEDFCNRKDEKKSEEKGNGKIQSSYPQVFFGDKQEKEASDNRNEGVKPGFNWRQADVSMESGGTIHLEESTSEEDTTILKRHGHGGSDGGRYIPSAYLTRKRTGEEVLVEGNVFHMGRERSFVNYYINGNRTISRIHADIIRREDTYWIKDTNSHNHTYINGQILTSNKEYELHSGDTIMLSDEKFEFKIK